MTPTERANQNTGGEPERVGAQGSPPWAIALGIAAVVLLVALMVVLHLTGVLGAGDH